MDTMSHPLIMPVICIDGNIGSGKSTVLSYLHTHYGCPVDVEPVERWQPFLKDLYHGRNAFDFQTRVWLDRCWLQQRTPNSYMWMERSPYFQRMVFIEAMRENGMVSHSQYEMLSDMYRRSFMQWAPQLFVYLRSDPNQCFQRVHRRNRSGEERIDRPYLENIHRLHEHAYYQAASRGMPMLVIDVEGKTVSQIAHEIWIATRYIPSPP